MELTIESYLNYTVQDAKDAVPRGELKAQWVKLLAFIKHAFISKRETVETVSQINSRPLIERMFLRFIENYKRRFATINLELAKILEEISNNPDVVIADPQDEYKRCQTLINLFTFADNLFVKIGYFDDELLKFQVKNALELSYQIEAEIKIIAFKGKAIKKTSPDLLQALSDKSKEGIIHSLKLSGN